MWIFSDIGFFSVVAADEEKLDRAPWSDAPLQSGPSVLIRARRRGHLEQLCLRMPTPAPPPGWQIYHAPGADYPYRIVIDRGAWCQTLATLGRDIDYGNFKAHVGAALGVVYGQVLHAVWQTVRALGWGGVGARVRATDVDRWSAPEEGEWD